MRRNVSVIALAVLLVLPAITACDNKKASSAGGGSCCSVDSAASVPARLRVKETKFEKESKYAKVEVEVEYPDGNDSVSCSIRNDLMGVLEKASAFNSDYAKIAPYKSETTAMAGAVDYYGGELFNIMGRQSAEDDKERNEFEKQSAQEEGREYEKVDVMQYYYKVEIEHEYESDRLCVYDAEVDLYSGGAHGASIDLGGLTYDKRTGKRFTAFLKPSAAKGLQQVLHEGLERYFAKEDNTMATGKVDLKQLLQIDGNVIPLPQLAPYPTAKGLVFLYGQYEIAAYAAGKPKVTVPYNKIKPFLTPEAVELLGL